MTRVAIIGLGIMGRRMLTHMRLHPGFSPELLWDPSPEACRAALAEAPEAAIAPSAEAAIAGAELVYLACPPVPRKAHALAAARSGAMGDLMGADIVVTYGAWPRDWQKEADWLRFRAEGGYVREVISHFLFFTERVLGPVRLVHARPDYPDDPALCETHILARLEAADGAPVSIFGAVGGAQPDRQELIVKGSRQSHRNTEL